MSYHVHPKHSPGPHPKNIIDICPVAGCPASTEARHLELNYSLGNITHENGQRIITDEKIVMKQRYHRRIVAWHGRNYFLWVLHDEQWLAPKTVYPSPESEGGPMGPFSN